MENSYVEHDDTNSQWYWYGHISVYLKGKCIQHFFIDELKEILEEFNIDFDLDEFIEELKVKYSITEVREKSDRSNWR